MEHTPFIRIAALACTIGVLLGFSARSSAENVRLYFDSATPQIAFAAGDITLGAKFLDVAAPVINWENAVQDDFSFTTTNPRGSKWDNCDSNGWAARSKRRPTCLRLEQRIGCHQSLPAPHDQPCTILSREPVKQAR